MPSDVRSPRTLASWLELDYHRRRRLLPGWGWWLLAGLLLGGAAVAGLYAARGDRAFQAGPLSRAHAMFNDDCSKCHSGNGITLTRLWRGDGVGSVDDAACQKCHAGAPHNQHAGPVGRCVQCHREHRGHEALDRLPDVTCVRCHGDLKAVYAEGKRAGRVMAFDASGHPPFATPADPGTVAFNHAVHLAPGGVLEAERGPDGRPVLRRLGCADCHVADPDGRYMKPVSYQQHCRSCHPLGANLVGDWRDPARLRQANLFKAAFLGRIEHPRPGQGAAGVRASVRDALTRFILDPAHAGFLGGAPAEAPRPLPDRDPVPGPTREAFEWVSGQMAEVERVLFDGPGGCKYCHATGEPAGGLPTVLPARIPNRWWAGASFAHQPHRMINCVECHPAGVSEKTADVLLPDLASCVRCHKPGGAGDRCVDCHAYHDPAVQRAARPERVLGIDWLLRR